LPNHPDITPLKNSTPLASQSSHFADGTPRPQGALRLKSSDRHIF
jgi:hypothetical protein